MKDYGHTLDISADVVTEAVTWRHHLHRHPELAFTERQTADFIAAQLGRFGLAVHRGLAGTGVIGTISRGTSRRTIAIRADMDALPIHEDSNVPHASCKPGTMHACGHDGHVAMALAAARVCAQLPNLDGTVHFIFQPAEENEGGARRMMEDGLFRLFPCDAVYALHNWPALPLGSCVALDGPMMAALAVFEIRIRGSGCHGAMPHQGTDCILAACQIVGAIHTIVGRTIEATQAAIISATQIHAGDTWNVIPDICLVRGTTRWFNDGIGDLLERRVTELSTSIAAGFGCEVQIHYDRRFPPTVNDPSEANFVRSICAAASGLRLADARPSMGSEDFAVMLRAIPGCYLWLGAGKGGDNPGLHSARYDFNDELLPLGIALWASVVQKRLGSV